MNENLSDAGERSAPLPPLEVIDDPEQVEAARRFAASQKPEPLSAAALAWERHVSRDAIPTGMPEDEAKLRLRKVIQDPDAPPDARSNACRLFALIDAREGQELILWLLKTGDAEGKRSLLCALHFFTIDERFELTNEALIVELVTLMHAPEWCIPALNAYASMQPAGCEQTLWEVFDSAEGDSRAAVLLQLTSIRPSRRALAAFVDALPELSARVRERWLTAVWVGGSAAEEGVVEKACEIMAGDLLQRFNAGQVRVSDIPHYGCTTVLRFGRGPDTEALVRALQDRTTDRKLLAAVYATRRRLEGPTGRTNIVSDLRRAETFENALFAAERDFEGTGDSVILAGLEDELKRQHTHYETMQLIRALIIVGGSQVCVAAKESFEGLPKRERHMLMAYVSVRPTVAVAQGLAEAGIVSFDDPKEFVARVHEWKGGMFGESAARQIGVLDMLKASGIALTFDQEQDETPARHDELVVELGRSTGGSFCPEATHEMMMRRDDEDWDAPYRIQFVHDGRLYRFTAENHRGWYDSGNVVTACNRALADSGSPMRFYWVDDVGQFSTLVCVTPRQARTLSEQFDIALSGV